MMHFLVSVFMLIVAVSNDTLKFLVQGLAPLVVPLGSSVVLPCSAETPLVAERLQVVWRRTDSEILVHLYHDGESHPEEQHKDYHDRAHFFTDQIQHGNFSLLLENVRPEDKGIYRCKVNTQQVAVKTLVEIKDVVYLLVSGSDESISAYVDEDVTLNCSVDSHFTPEHIKEVSWKRADEDGDILVLLYQNNMTLPYSSDEQFRDRVEFFTDQIPKGNFSLRLKSVRTEDKGVYMCQVFAGELSANATVILRRLGFSVCHKMVLILCIFAFGSALVYSRPEKEDARLSLQVCIFLCPNIIMVVASIIWHVIEGSLHETICCCVLYILRSFWVTPLATGVPEKSLKHVRTSHADHAVFMAVMYSVLVAEHIKDIDTVLKTVFFCSLVLICLLFIIQLAEENLLSCSGNVCRRTYGSVRGFLSTCSFSLLPSLQLALLLYTRFAYSAVFIVAIPSVLYWISCFFCKGKSRNCCLYLLDKLIWSIMIVMSATMVYFYIMLLRNKQEGAGLICVAGILQAIWVLAFSEVPGLYLRHRKMKMLFLFGSAGLVLVNSVTLMTEVIVNAVNGERLVGDLRVVLFTSEWLFTVPLLILSMFTAWKADGTQSQEDSQSPDFKGTPATEYISIELKMTGGSDEMETLGKVAGNSEEQIDM